MRGVLNRLSVHGHVPPRLFQYSLVDIYRLKALNPALYRRPLGKYSMRKSTHDDIPALIRLTPDREAIIRADFNQGQAVHVVCAGERLVAYMEVYHDAYEISRGDTCKCKFDLVLPPGVRFLGYGYIDPGYRMKGLFPYLLKHVVDTYPDTIILTMIDRANDPSWRAHLRIGFQRILSIRAISLFCANCRWALIESAEGAKISHWRGGERVALRALLEKDVGPGEATRHESEDD